MFSFTFFPMADRDEKLNRNEPLTVFGAQAFMSRFMFRFLYSILLILLNSYILFYIASSASA